MSAVGRSGPPFVRGRGWSGNWGHVAALLVAVVVLGGPALFTHSGFARDYPNHLWLVDVQMAAIRAHLAPTYYLSAGNTGIDYPFFLFYGATLYTVTGTIGAVLGGDGTAAYVLMSLLAIGAAYGGLLWLARQLGVRGWMAHGPAVTFVGSAYYVTDYYGRGAWPELVATSMIPLVLASVCSVARAERVTWRSVAALVGSWTLFVGSHNITLAVGSTFMLAVVVLLRLAVGSAVSVRQWTRLPWLAGLLALGVGLDAWFLLPDVAHASSTMIGSGATGPWSSSAPLATPLLVFDPLRKVSSYSSTPGLFVQAPDWMLAWSLAALAVLAGSMGGALRRAALVLVGLLALTFVAMFSPGVWNHLPQFIGEMQFTYRMLTYVSLLAAGLVLVAALAVQRARSSTGRTRALRVALAAAMAISVALCVWQLWVPTTLMSTSFANLRNLSARPHVLPHSFYATSDYQDAAPPVVPAPAVNLTIVPSRMTANRVTLTVPAPATQPFTLNFYASPYAVALSPNVVRVGRTSSGQEVLRRARPGRGPLRITFAPAGGSITIGRDITLLALLVLVALALAWPVGRLVRRSGTIGA